MDIATEYLRRSSGNHYAIIHDLFFRGSPFERICHPPRRHYFNDIRYRILLERELVLVVTVEGMTSVAEIMQENLKEKKKLRVKVSLGRTGEIKGNLTDAMLSHVSMTTKLVDDELIEAIVLPVAKAIEKSNA